MRISKRILVLLLALLLCVSLFPAAGFAGNASAEEKGERTVIASGSCGSRKNWTLYSDGELYISGSWESAPYYFEWDSAPYDFESIPWNGYPDENGDWVDSPYKSMVKSVVIDENGYMTSLHWVDEHTTGKGVFEGMTALKTVEVRNTQYVSIGERCFAGCTSLETLIGAIRSVTRDSFKDCSSLNGLVFWKRHPAGNVKLKYDPWSGCTSLTDIYYVGSKAMWNDSEYGRIDNYPSKSVIHKAKLHTHYAYLPACYFRLRYSKYAYTGKAIKPKVTVKTVCGTTLKEGLNYTVSYENNIEYGCASLVITGIGKYSGITRRVTFEIRPGKVKNLRQISATETSATAAWEHPLAQGYLIRLDYPTYEYDVEWDIQNNGAFITAENTYTATLPFSTHYRKCWLVYIRAVVTVTDPVTGEEKDWYGISDNILLVPTKEK